MNEETNEMTHMKPLWGALDDMSKPEKREILFRETEGRCILCGKERTKSNDWSMAQIIPARHSRYTRIDGRTILCLDCVEKKGLSPIPLYASSLPFKARFAYWNRVRRSFKKGLISKEKKELLLRDFTLMSRHHSSQVKKGTQKYYRILFNETRGTCIYCGIPLEPEAVTFDHILPRSLGGTSSLDNYVISCPDCNVLKDKLPVDEFVRRWPEKRRTNYSHRVKDLLRNGVMPRNKGKLLLSFENEHSKRFGFRLFRRLFSVTITETKI